MEAYVVPRLVHRGDVDSTRIPAVRGRVDFRWEWFPVLKALEVQVGYCTRGYVGIGVNMTYLLERLTGHRAWGVFDSYQMPYTYLPTKWKYE